MIPSNVSSFKFVVEANAFGVCSKMGEKLGMSTRHIRLFFIYASCLTIGSPVIIYMILAFWMQMRYYVRGKRSPIWDY